MQRNAAFRRPDYITTMAAHLRQFDSSPAAEKDLEWMRSSG